MIDVFCHWAPEVFCRKALHMYAQPVHMLERALAMDVMSDVKTRINVMEGLSGYKQIPSLVSPPIETIAGSDQSPDLACIANDEMKKLVEAHPDYFPSFVAALPLNNMEEALKETERAVKQLNAAGVQIFTQINGKPVDTQEMMELYALIAELDSAIWLHPCLDMKQPDYKDEEYSKYELWWAMGWPYESAKAMYRLVFAGVFEQWPDLKIITHHAGSLIPMIEGRLDRGMEVYGTRTPADLNEKGNTPLKGKPIDSFRKFYADTATLGSRIPILAGAAFFGIDRMLFGTDMPFGSKNGASCIKETLRAISEMDLNDTGKEKICFGNAERVLKIKELGNG
jgi:predicted TIM-barrel fold metal-dependent hydrolase